MASSDGGILGTVKTVRWFEGIRVCGPDRIVYLDRSLSELFTSDRSCDDFQTMDIRANGGMDDFAFDDGDQRLYVTHSVAVRHEGYQGSRYEYKLKRLEVTDDNGIYVAGYRINNNCSTRLSVVLSKSKTVYLTVSPVTTSCSQARVIKLKPLER